MQLNTKTADAVARVNAAQLLLDQCSTALIARDEAETALEVAKAAVGGDKAARAKVAVLLSAGFKAAEEEVPVTNGAFVYEEGYSYRVAISYYAESRAYSPVVNPPVVVIPDDRVPVGPGPSGGGTPVTIIDDDVPMGALPARAVTEEACTPSWTTTCLWARCPRPVVPAARPWAGWALSCWLRALPSA